MTAPSPAETPFVDPMPGIPLVESPFFERRIAHHPQLPAGSLAHQVAQDLHRDGFAVFEIPVDDFDRLAARVLAQVAPLYDWTPWTTHGVSIRVMDAWRTCDAVRELATAPGLLDLLSRVYERRAIPFQTLNFPVGTEQHFHSDAIHFNSYPERFMCGVWVALEDTDADNGPLYYYPGSHALPIVTHEQIGTHAPREQEIYEPAWRALVEHHGLEPVPFHARKGQAVVWTANLLHGGTPQRDRTRTRHSQVSHYYFENCCYYMPHHSDPMRGSIEFRPVVDIATGAEIPQRFVLDDLPAETLARLRATPEELDRNRSRRDFTIPHDFDPALYLAANPDVAAAGADPVYHYRRYGRWEGRPIRP